MRHFAIFVCLSVCHIRAFTENWNAVESFYFVWRLLYASEGLDNFDIKSSKAKVTRNENVNASYTHDTYH